MTHMQSNYWCPAKTPLATRLRVMSEVDQNGCWIWQAVLDHGGRSRIKIAGRSEIAHRISYEVFVGPIPGGLEIDHLCCVAACINPEHLEPVTPEENERRRQETWGQGDYSVACSRGHQRSEETTYVSPSGRRCCRTCNTLAVARYSARQKAATGAQA